MVTRCGSLSQLLTLHVKRRAESQKRPALDLSGCSAHTTRDPRAVPLWIPKCYRSPRKRFASLRNHSRCEAMTKQESLAPTPKKTAGPGYFGERSTSFRVPSNGKGSTEAQADSSCSSDGASDGTARQRNPEASGARDDDCGILWIDSGKTRNAKRHLRIPEFLRPHLRELVGNQSQDAYLFVSSLSGRPVRHPSLWAAAAEGGVDECNIFTPSECPTK